MPLFFLHRRGKMRAAAEKSKGRTWSDGDGKGGKGRERGGEKEGERGRERKREEKNRGVFGLSVYRLSPWGMNDHRDERKWEIMRGSWRGMRARAVQGQTKENKGRRGKDEKMRSDE